MKFNKLSKKQIFKLCILLGLIGYGVYYSAISYMLLDRISGIIPRRSKLQNVKAERISIEQAKNIIGNYSSDGMVDITKDEVFNKLGYQIFIDHGNSRKTYVIKGNKSILLETNYFTNSAVLDTCAADLNKDGIPELIFTYYNPRAGYFCSRVGVMVLDEEDYQYDARVVYPGDLSLTKVNDQCVIVQYNKGRIDLLNKGDNGTFKSSWFRKDLGLVTLEAENSHSVFNVEPNRQLPANVHYIIGIELKKWLPGKIKYKTAVN